MPQNFSFVLPNQLAGMAFPGTDGSLESDLDFLVDQGIRALVTLTMRQPNPQAVRARGLKSLHLPINDFSPPKQSQVDAFVHFVAEQLAQDHPVAVHCGVGQGRTGTMLACYLVHTGIGPDDAIRRIRQLRPGSVETREQEDAIHEFARSQPRTD